MLTEGLRRFFGLEPEKEPDKEYRYRRTREDFSYVDRMGHVRTVRRHLRTADDWEAFYSAVWSSSLEAIAKAAGLPFSRVATGLRAHSPFRVRYSPTGHHVW